MSQALKHSKLSTSWKLLTHTAPDLDAMMSGLLLKTYGQAKYAGIEHAEITFTSANNLPNGLSPNQLEKQNIIAIDIGGGKYDSHPSKATGKAKADRSATDLVAEDLGVLNDPAWKWLIEYTRMHDTKGHVLFSNEQIHHVTSLNAILSGLALLHPKDNLTVYEKGISVISLISYYLLNLKEEIRFDCLKQVLQRVFVELEIDDLSGVAHLTTFAEWFDLLETSPELAWGQNKMDKVISLIAIFHGAFHRYGQESVELDKVMTTCVRAIFARQESWHKAVESFDQTAKIKSIGEHKVLTLVNANGLALKVAKFKERPAFTIYKNPESFAMTVMMHKSRKLWKFPFKIIVASIRIAEALEMEEHLDFDVLDKLGTYYGWYFHQSGNLLIRGSKKQVKFIPTRLKLEVIENLVYSAINSDVDYDLPADFYMALLKYQNPVFRTD